LRTASQVKKSCPSLGSCTPRRSRPAFGVPSAREWRHSIAGQR
jgi:hypothetical protein